MVTRALDLVLLGAPGAGKGTQAKRIGSAFDLLHLSTGDLLRDEVARCTALGGEVKDFMNRGKLVPDELVARILLLRLHSQQAGLGCVYDGYPRTVAQAQLLDGLLAELNRRVDVVMFLAVPDDMLVARMDGRRSCPSCGAVYHVDDQPSRVANVCDGCGAELTRREDDREEVVRERLRVYHETTAPLLGLYRGRNILREVAGTGSPDEVAGRIRDAMRGVRK
ncbi:MAG: adenylate kinase [Acidobacteriota bacterium]